MRLNEKRKSWEEGEGEEIWVKMDEGGRREAGTGTA